MKNDYLSRMVFKPDYLVKFENGRYTGIPMSGNVCYSVSSKPAVMVIRGYAASKNHSTEPVQLLIEVYGGIGTEYFAKDTNIVIYRVNPNDYSKDLYNATHDLFVYSNFASAVLAGKEMSIQEEIDHLLEKREPRKENPFGSWLGDLFKNQVYSHFNEMYEKYMKEFFGNDGAFMSAYNKAKETAKEYTDRASDFGQRTKDGVTKLVDELKRDKKAAEENAPQNGLRWLDETCAFYKELTEKWGVTLKHRKNMEGKSKYSLTVFNLFLGSEMVYHITREQFKDIYEILVEDAPGRVRFNSIVDILGDAVLANVTRENTANRVMHNDKEEKITTCAKKEKAKVVTDKPETKNIKKENVKKFPIQMVEFREQDIVKHDEAKTKKASKISNTKKSVGPALKYKEGDRVIVVKGKYVGHSGVIKHIERVMSGGIQRVQYHVYFPETTLKVTHPYYSYMLEKL